MNAEYISYESMVATREAAEWAYWSMIGTWVAGCMTFAAVCISLIVAFQRPKPKIKGSIAQMFFYPPGMRPRSGIGVNIYNRGTNTISISSLIWNFGKTTRLVYAVDMHGHKLPKRLEHGESATFFYWSDENGEWVSDVKENILKSGGKIEKMQLEVSLGTGDVIFIKPPAGIIKLLLDA